MQERVAIAGSGTIASGLAAVAAAQGEVLVWARSQVSAERAERAVAKHCEKVVELNGCAKRVRIVTEIEALADSTFLVEAICEELDCKSALLAQLGSMTGPQEILATTTSSLSIAELADVSGHPDRFLGLHVFNPVPRMELVELAYAPATRPELRARARDLCAALGKTPVEVPDTPGFVVNRLLFPYLFDAVSLMERTGMAAEDVDRCMTLGAGMPMGPLALLDFVGLDVSAAIGETIDVTVPQTLRELVREGALGRKSGRGFHDYG
ncbi:MAG TPA: 3-hydroxyacyl-CoA dehydrogenase family protein [Solirubrobacteraceae bacterium]|nr:3-hydroxyacyl-CoA dehydrogenase family protein [Solirubrobacteraceae bacterium]